MDIPPGNEASDRLLDANYLQRGNDESEAEEEDEALNGVLETDDEQAWGRKTRRLLYTSHLLSTWNSRLFEFGAFLFLARAFPQTLLPASVYALSRAASAAVLSPCLGSYIDRADRLHAVRHSIVGQRLAVALSCIGLYSLAHFPALRASSSWSAVCLAILSLLACVEKLSWIMNTISVERDWAVIVAGGDEDTLRMINAQMRRIDLFCKLIAPLTIAIIDGVSTEIAVVATGCLTVSSVFVEYFTIARVYHTVPNLSAPKVTNHGDRHRDNGTQFRVLGILPVVLAYTRHPAFLPSFSLALLYLTVLSFGGQMVTYLLALGLSSGTIGVLRGVSALLELSATWIAPKVMKRIGPVRAGIWFLNWEIVCVAIACMFFWLNIPPAIAAAGTISAVMLSRVGLWGFDLSAQIIVQEEVEPDYRGTFSSQEFALQNIFEMLTYASTIVFPRPADFKYPALVSAAAVTLAGCLYAVFVRGRRGHLIHLSQCVDRNGRHKDHHHWWMGSLEREERSYRRHSGTHDIALHQMAS